ncbi:hypothetical protein [Sphaerochaeta sp.]|uniref:hypothetical protein n=1 Tax=Sphaerochaeta sp. TaxID=1972642 RepID=UPI003D104353
MPQMTAERLVERMKGIPEFILSKIVEILDSYDKESTVAEGILFERCPKCGVIQPEDHKGRQDIHRQADVQVHALPEPVHRRLWHLLILFPPEP